LIIGALSLSLDRFFAQFLLQEFNLLLSLHRVEDAITMSYREELGYRLSENEADYAPPSFFFSLLTVGVMLAALTLFYRKLFMRGRTKSRVESIGVELVSFR
jgi:hypothetical protein